MWDDAGKLARFREITRDVSELRLSKKKCWKSAQREQMRIGHDLHDGVGQERTGVALTQTLTNGCAQGLPEEAQAARIVSPINPRWSRCKLGTRLFAPRSPAPGPEYRSLRYPGRQGADNHCSGLQPELPRSAEYCR